MNYTSSQQDMENFRLKLAAILLDSPFNTCKYEEEEDEEEEAGGGDPNDCVIIDKTGHITRANTKKKKTWKAYFKIALKMKLMHPIGYWCLFITTKNTAYIRLI